MRGGEMYYTRYGYAICEEVSVFSVFSKQSGGLGTIQSPPSIYALNRKTCRNFLF